MGKKASSQIGGFEDVLFRVRVGFELHSCHFHHVPHIPLLECSLLSVGTVDLKGFTTTFVSRRRVVRKEENFIVTETLQGSF